MLTRIFRLALAALLVAGPAFAGGYTPPAGGTAGTVTSIATGAGLTGGPITGSGTISFGAPPAALAALGLNTLGPPAPNGLDNAEMRIQSYGTSFTNVASGGSKPQMVVDRWGAFRGGFAANLSVSAVTGPANYSAALRLQRASGDTSTQPLFAVQIIESIDCARFAGKTVTLSAVLRAGANFSGANAQATLAIGYGTGVDEGRAKLISGWTGAGSVSGAVTVSTAAARVGVQLAIPSTATELAVYVAYTPTGTAGSADYLDATGVQLEEGSAMGPFDRVPIAQDVMRCARHYAVVTLPTFVDNGTASGRGCYFGFTLPVPMRITPNMAVTTTGALTNASALGTQAASPTTFAVTTSASGSGQVVVANGSVVTFDATL